MAIIKCINSESKQYKPVLTDKLVLDAVPTVNSLNSVTSDAVARAIAGASGEVPQVTENDNGKILTATYDELGPAVSWEEAPSGIPDMTGKDGKILGAVDNSGTMEAQWIDKPVSNVTTTDKAFTVGVNGTGMPIAVDCANAAPTSSSISLGSGSYMGLRSPDTPQSADFPSVIFPYDMSSIPHGAYITITFVIPASIDASSIAGIAQGTWASITYKSTGTYGRDAGTPAPTMPSSRIYDAGTYTATFRISSNVDISTHSGFALMFPGGGSPDGWSTFCDLIESVASSITCTISVPTGYTIKPSVIATPGSDAAGKVLTVTDTQGNYGWQPVPQELPAYTTSDDGKVLGVTVDSTGETPVANVEWVTPSGGGSSDVPSYTASDLTKVLTVAGNSGNQWLRWDPVWKSMTFTEQESGESWIYSSSYTYFKKEKTLLELYITGTLPSEIYITTDYRPDPMLPTVASTPVLKTKGGTVCTTLQAWENDSSYHPIKLHVYDASDDSHVTGLTISAIYQNIV